MIDPAWLKPAMTEWRDRGLERVLELHSGSPPNLNFADNDYLALSRDPAVIEGAMRALRDAGGGARASRLMAGNLELHETLERRLAELKGFPAALLFGSGFLANLGAITALAGRSDTVLIDRLAHASLVDGVRLSRARWLRFRHNDPEHLRDLARRIAPGNRLLIVTETVFSMDGDRAPLEAIAAVAAGCNAMLLVDEAHATGVFGSGGAGLFNPAEYPDVAALAVGTLSKALGAYGGFVACSEALRAHLIQRARAFVYSTAPPPAAVGAALAALDACARCPDMGAELLRRAAIFRQRLRAAGVATGSGDSQIVPAILGSNTRSTDVAAGLRRRGIVCPAIRPPTVPPGSARLRFSITRRHSSADLERAAAATLECLEQTRGF